MQFPIAVIILVCWSCINAAPVETHSVDPMLRKRYSEVGQFLRKRNPQEERDANNDENQNNNEENAGAGADAGADNNNNADAGNNNNDNDAAANGDNNNAGADAGGDNNNNAGNNNNDAADAGNNNAGANAGNNNNDAAADAGNNNNDAADAGNNNDAAADAGNNNNNNDAADTDNNNDNDATADAGNNNAGANAGNNNDAAADAGNNNAGAAAGADAGAAAGGAAGAANGAAFCNGQTLADGTQQQDSTCSVTVQGTLPAVANMVSTLITSPADASVIQAGAEVTVNVVTLNMDLGFFDDPNTEYYNTPQTLNAQGLIEGHQHIIVQSVGNGQAALDPNPNSLTFFQGLDGQDNNGVLTTVVPAGTITEPGVYRFCTITGTRGHQPVIMPVARRGAQDDCVRVTVQ